MRVYLCVHVADKSKYGYRMLEQMGWSEGKGLGKEEDGDTQHIRISKKADMRGQLLNSNKLPFQSLGAHNSSAEKWEGLVTPTHPFE